MTDPTSRRAFFSRLIAAGLAVVGWRARPLAAAPPPKPTPVTGSFEWSTIAGVVNAQGGAAEMPTFTWTISDVDRLPRAST